MSRLRIRKPWTLLAEPFMLVATLIVWAWFDVTFEEARRGELKSGELL